MPYKSRKSCLFLAFCLEILSFVRKTAPISGLETAFGAPVRKTAPISGRSVRGGAARGAEGGAVPKFFYEVFTVVENVVIKFLTCFVTL